LRIVQTREDLLFGKQRVEPIPYLPIDVPLFQDGACQ
jgi:hypothetical protein